VLLVASVVTVLVTLGPETIRAESEGRAATLQRAAGNVLGGPFDVALTPVVAARALWANGKAAGYDAAGMISLGIIGSAWMLPLNGVTGLFRIWSGLIELPIGLGLLASKSFTDWQPPALFDVEHDPAIVDYPNRVVPIKFGVSHLASGSAG